MEIKNLREWLAYTKGKTSTATNRPASIGQLMHVVELLIEIEEEEAKKK